jgi:hypothetical protein
MQTNKALVGVVIGMGAVLVVGMAVLAYGLAMKSADPSFRFFSTSQPTLAKDAGRAASTASNITVQLPMGTSVVSVVRADELLMVHTVDEEDNSAILFIDPNDGRIVRRIAFGGRR